MKLSVTGKVVVERVEDGRQALICEPFPIVTGHSDDENGMTVRLQSWDEDTVHTDLNLIRGKTVKITIEVLD